MPELPQVPNDTLAADTDAEALLERLRFATRGEYDIYGELGRGGMATVYLAHEISLDRKVAIKVMHPGMVHGPGLVERFKREARTAASLAHPNIIPIYAVREAEGLLFCVIKLVQGTPLDAIMRDLGKLPVAMVQAILAQVGDALGYAHRHGVVHRDIKPGNILIDEEGWAVVTDFGIAKVQETEGLTMTGMAVGTPAYMSPEQASGDVVTGASDQYSLGIVAYEMLAGRTPFTGTSMMALMYSHFHDDVPPLEALRPDCPPEMRDAVTRMLRKNPDDRWLSMEEATIAMGARPLARDDPTRSQLITLARTSVNHRIISQVQTPRSPIPLTRKRYPTPAEPRPVARRNLVLLGGAGLALLGAGYLIARLASPNPVTSPALEAAAPVESATVDSSGPVAASPGPPSTPPEPNATRPPDGRASRVTTPAANPPTRQASTPPLAAVPPQGATATETPPVRAPTRPVVGDTAGQGSASRQDVIPRQRADSTTAAVTPVPPPVPSRTAVDSPASSTRTQDAATPVVTVESEIRAVIDAFAKALAAADLATARRLYPGMSTEQREGFEALWKDGGTMTPRWSVSDIAVDGVRATARIAGTNVVTTRRGQPQVVPVALRARFEKRGADWRLILLVN